MHDYEILKLMNEINYGWVDKDGNKHVDDFDTFSDDYLLQSPKELLNNKVGICWDQVELERYYFSNCDCKIRTYFIVNYDNDNCSTHTFLTYEKDDSFYWIENSWEMFRGIYEYSSLKDLLDEVREKFIEQEIDDNVSKYNIVIYEYSKPKYNISVKEFFKHCESGKVIENN